MNGHGRRRHPRNDPGGRLLLASISVTFIVFGLLKAGQWISAPLLILGFIAAILFAFHSRIRGLKIFDKVEMPIAAEAPLSELPPRPETPRLEPPTQRPSLRQISQEAHNPTTDRHRDSRARKR
ncbi:MAG TPA: hypothetical protein VGW80_09370 [Solirubrobacterales bacterium]|nr:hypothetical protein [Solirubrobacterales bacterium]